MDSSRHTTIAAESKLSRSSLIVIIIMLSGAFIAVLNQTVLAPALPSIMADLQIDTSKGQWLTTAFMLVNGIMIPTTAYFINKFTTRQIFLASMLFFTIGTAIAGFAQHFAVLMIARVLQAVGAGILMPMIQTVLLLLFPKEKRGAAMGTVGIVIAVAPAIGPTLAGWAVDVWGWHSLFLVIAPVALVDVILAVILLKNVGSTEDVHLDVPSVIHSSLGFGGLLYGCSSAGSYGWGHPLTLVPLAIGIVFLILFIQRQLKMEQPLLELRIFRSSIFTYSTIMGMIVNAALIAGTIITPLFMQNILQFSAMQSGMALFPGAVLMAIMSPVTGHLFDRFGPRALSLTGLSILTAGSIGLVLLDENCTFALICGIYTVRMFGMSMVTMPLTTWGLNALENDMLAHGSAIYNTMRQVAGSIGTAILITIMTIFTKHAAASGAVSATLHGMHVAYAVGAALCAVALVLAVLFVHNRQELVDELYVKEESQPT